jgi:hypothetical protein
MNSEQYTGPLFIVGMPRSGTKLLRDLLNQNPFIGIPEVESHFIPYLVRRYKDQKDLSTDVLAQKKLLDDLRLTSFLINMESNGYHMSEADFKKLVNWESWASIFESIFRYYAPPGRGAQFIWGDKTPGYVNHLLFLKEIFPRAKFIHIIRDPRDYALSVRKTWGKNIYRAAERWRITLISSHKDGQSLGEDYLEVYFEQLLENSEATMKQISDFLGCEFKDEMINLTRPSEMFGDARGQARIIQGNREKFRTQLSQAEIKRIEEIVFPGLRNTPYKCEYNSAGKFKSLHPLSQAYLKLLDSWAMMKFNARIRGFKPGLKYLYFAYRKSSWR